MINYQRYLREKRKVLSEEIEQLEEINKFGRAMAGPAGAAATKAANQQAELNRLKAKYKSGTTLSNSEATAYDSLSKKAGETAPKKVLDLIRGSSGGSSGTGSPGTGPTGTGSPGTGPTGTGSPSGGSSGSGSTGPISGDTISEIALSAGLSRSDASEVVRIVQDALRRADISLSDSSFLS